MSRADVCLILEGAYPFVAGGVSGWTQALIEAAPHLTFHLVSITPDQTPRAARYAIPANVVAWTTLALDSGGKGRSARTADQGLVTEIGARFESMIMRPDIDDLHRLARLLAGSQIGQSALLDSRAGWRAMEAAATRLLPNAPLLDFFWTWRVMLRSLITVLTAPLPDASVYHAISTGYAGLLGARAALETGRPFVLTEHGIYTNERRIELCLADWIYDSGADGFSIAQRINALRDLWAALFSSLSNLAYATASEIVTLYRGNQVLQAADGAAAQKLRIIPNGVDVARWSAVRPIPTTERRPTIALIGRVVPIKDVRMFILACAALRRNVPNLEALVIGPDDEDAVYATECRKLALSEGLGACLRFTGRADVASYLPSIDVCVLTSVSEAQPLVLLEAGAAGIPSVATDVGCCRDLIEGSPGDDVAGHGGIVVPVGDSAAAAKALSRLLGDDALRTRMGEVMRRRVRQSYDKTRIDRIYNDLYAGHLNGAEARVA